MMKYLPALTILLGGTLPGAADFFLDVDLGVLPLGDTTITGTTEATIDPGPPAKIIGGHDESRFVRGIGLIPTLNWGNEIVYRLEIQQPSNISITSNSIGGDPDFFLLDGLAVSTDPETGKASGEDGVASAFLDSLNPPETEVFGAVLPGTYYLLVEHYSGPDGNVTPGNSTFDVTLTVTEEFDPFSFLIDLVHVAREGSPVTFDTFGSSFDTELAIYDTFGALVAENDDAGGGLQSELAFPDGLPAGDYYAVIAGNDATFEENFVVTAGAAAGDWVFNFPFGPTFGPGQEFGATVAGFPGSEVSFFLFSISAPPPVVVDLGTIAAADEPFSLDTVGSLFGLAEFENDTQLALYDGEGFVSYFNDDIDFDGGNYLSILDFAFGLPEGEYYLVLAGYPNFYSDGFFATVDTRISDTSFGGDYVLNHPLGTATGSIAENGQEWFVFQVGPSSTFQDPITITDIAFNDATNEFTVTWDSTLAGPFNIFVGDGASLAALAPAPGNVLPTLGAASVTSPATFTVPPLLQGSASLFLQVTD